MKNPFFFLVILSFLFAGCNQEQDPFQISKQHIGLLTDSTQVKDLKIIYAKDSIVKSDDNGFSGYNNDIEIFEKGGNKLLSLSPTNI